METGAAFSPCGAYRFRLWREWRRGSKAAAFVMLNPSTADEFTNDPTVERCQRRAIALGFGRLEVVNLFALRSTNPRALVGHPDPVGAPENDAAIDEVVEAAGLVVCAWGSHRMIGARGAAVLDRIRAAGKVPHALAINRDGNPAHPLYIPLAVTPRPLLPPDFARPHSAVS